MTVAADLLDAEQTAAVVKGSSVVYFTAGLPPDTALWERPFPTMLRNALDACPATGASFAYFDNTYMYPQDGRLQMEATPFAPVGRKDRVRAAMASMVLEEMARGNIPVLIGRAPEFYGPGKTQSFTNALVIDRLKTGRTPRVPVRDDRLRTLIWTPDASRALAALGNAPDAWGADLAPALLRRPADLPAVRRDGLRGLRPGAFLHRRRQVDVDRRWPLFPAGARAPGTAAAL